jgi:hypothetical protein
LEPDRLELEYSDEAQYDQVGNAGGNHALMLSLRESVTPGYFKCMKLKRCYLILAMAEWTTSCQKPQLEANRVQARNHCGSSVGHQQNLLLPQIA